MKNIRRIVEQHTYDTPPPDDNIVSLLYVAVLAQFAHSVQSWLLPVTSFQNSDRGRTVSQFSIEIVRDKKLLNYCEMKLSSDVLKIPAISLMCSLVVGLPDLEAATAGELSVESVSTSPLDSL